MAAGQLRSILTANARLLPRTKPTNMYTHARSGSSDTREVDATCRPYSNNPNPQSPTPSLLRTPKGSTLSTDQQTNIRQGRWYPEKGDDANGKLPRALLR